LRPLRADDVPAVVRACQDPETQRWTTLPVPYTERDAVWFVEEHSPAVWASADGGVWGVCTPEDDSFAGSMDVRRDLVDPAMADVGFATAPWGRGRGLTTRALRLACGWAFETLGFARIEWRAYVGNDGSRRVAEKAGFRYEGVQRSRLVQRGERRDCWVAAMLPDDLARDGLARADLARADLARADLARDDLIQD
jgi:RimJ/RimL family protein N-acetyltransferase